MREVNYDEKVINEFMGWEYSEEIKAWVKPRLVFVPENSRGINSGNSIYGYDFLEKPYSMSVDDILKVFEELQFCKFDVCWAVNGYRCILTLVDSYTACEKTIPLAMAKSAVMAIERLNKSTSED